MARNRYQKYIMSDEWVEKRAGAIARAGGRCEVCRHARATQAHHLTYARLGDERPEDLQAVCVSCHARHHPDKMDGRFIPVVEAGCDMCPNDMVEVFWEGRTCCTFCPHCGHSTRTNHPASKRAGGPQRARRREKERPRVSHDDAQRQKEWERVQWIKEQQRKQRQRP